MNRSAPLLDLENLVVGYGRPVCRPVCLSLARGERVGLAGPNGAGKTTLLDALTGAPVTIFSGRMTRDPAARISIVEQHSDHWGECPLTVRDLLRICGTTLKGLPEPLAALLNRRLDTLSGGQRQLLRVWVSLGSDAVLVFLDEPTNHLDPDVLLRLETLLRNGHHDRGLLMVSHDEGFLSRVCDRVVRLESAGAMP